MRTVYLFNPENDLALAFGGVNYTATPRGKLMARDLAVLPAWLARPGDAVVVDDDSQRAWLDSLGLGVDSVCSSELASLDKCRFQPWGWSASVRRRLQSRGVADAMLPTAGQVDAVCALSHRRLTVDIHRRVGELLGRELSPLPVELSDVASVQAFIAASGGCHLKLPWSGSGHGIYRTADPQEDHMLRWVAGGLRRQGSLLCEKTLRRLQDFGTEWWSESGRVRFVGYSVFETDAHSQYALGKVAPGSQLHQMLSERFPAPDAVVSALESALTGLVAPRYEGPLGVDMMYYLDDAGNTCINPCVEVNVRLTMGHLTLALAERHGMEGNFRIVPVERSAGRRLTPVLPGTRMVAEVVG